MYTYIYICMYTYIYIHMYVYIYMYTMNCKHTVVLEEGLCSGCKKKQFWRAEDSRLRVPNDASLNHTEKHWGIAQVLAVTLHTTSSILPLQILSY